jgi:hypothetical protein
MSQSNTNNSNSFKELLTTASNNYLKKPLTDTFNTLSNMAMASNHTVNNNKNEEKLKNNQQTQLSSVTTNTYSYSTTITNNNNNGATSLNNIILNDENTSEKSKKIDQLEFLTTVGTGTFGKKLFPF